MARFVKDIYNARPWYHDFSKLGVHTNFDNYLPMKVRLKKYVLALLGRKVDILNLRGEPYVKNQRDKEKYILSYLMKAFQLNKSRNVTFLELFCADGYYSFWVKKFLNPSICIGIDLNESDIKRCLLMKDILGFSGMEFVQKDVYELPDSEQFDVVLNAGGLYHVTQPEKLLQLCFRITKKYMILQTVTTLETEAEGYFVSPAPGWKHGCRFTDAWLVRRLVDIGWNILEHDRDILSGNERLCDKGSSYFLCQKQ